MNLRIFALLGLLSCAVYCPAFAESDVDTEMVEEDQDYAADDEYDVDYDDEEDYYDEADDYEDEEETDDTVPVAKEVPVATGKRVVERVTCANIGDRIAELREDVKFYPELAPELDKLLKQQRNQCSPKAARRPVRNYDNVGIVMASMEVPAEVLEVETEQADVNAENPKKTIKKSSKKKSKGENPEDKKTDEIDDSVRAANFAAGLCADGAKPNKFGCCAGERFKETSQMKFECCTDDGNGVCHAPLK